MAGLFCLDCGDERESSRDLADRLARAMVYFPHQSAHVEVCCGGRIFLGVVINGGIVGDPSQFVMARGNVSCAVEGHISSASEACGAGALLAADRYAEAVLEIYARRGAEFAAIMHGQFNAVVVDGDARRVLIANGRHAQSPLYLYEGSSGRAVATALGPLGSCGLFRPALDQVAVLTFLTYAQLFGERTLLEGVRVLDGATVAEWRLNEPTCRQRRYWDYHEIGPRLEGRPIRQLADDLCDLLNASADRMVRRSGRLMSGLSGGNDSRLVTGLAARRRPDLRAWTFGAPGSPDLPVAATVCKTLGIEHLRFGVEPGDLSRHAEGFATLVDGSMTAAHAFFLPRAALLREQADVVLNGYGGDYLLQGGLLDLGPQAMLAYARHLAGLGPNVPHPHLERNRSREAIIGYIAARYGRPSGLAPLLVPSAPEFAEIAMAELERDCARVPREYLVERWGFENRGRRWTMLGSVSDRHFYGDDCVYYDDELFDRCLAAPPRLRRGNQLHNLVVTTLLPDIAGIVSSNTGLPANCPAWRVSLARTKRYVLRRLLAGRSGYSTGVDIEGWSRGVQRLFYLDLLGDRRTLNRPFWDGHALRARYDAHLAGHAAFGREMGLVAAVELFARRWVDPGSDQPAP